MYIPNPVPKGPIFVYVMYDEDAKRYKVGYSKSPNRRRGELRSGRFRRLVKVYHKWRFDDFFAALYVEQAFIRWLTRRGYGSDRGHDYFDNITEHEIDKAIGEMEQLTEGITIWEKLNARSEWLSPRRTAELPLRGN